MGNPLGYYRVAQSYEFGQGVNQTDELAKRYYTLATLGNANATWTDVLRVLDVESSAQAGLIRVEERIKLSRRVQADALFAATLDQSELEQTQTPKSKKKTGLKTVWVRVFECSNCAKHGHDLITCDQCESAKWCNDRCRQRDAKAHEEKCVYRVTVKAAECFMARCVVLAPPLFPPLDKLSNQRPETLLKSFLETSLQPFENVLKAISIP